MGGLDELTARVRAAVSQDSGLGKTLKLDLKGDGFLFIDGAEVSNEDRPADLTVTISGDDLRALAERRLDPMGAVISRRMQVSDMGLAMGLQGKLQALFSRMGS